MQRFRADKAVPQEDGSIAQYAQWFGGPTLSKINSCRISGHDYRLTVYVTGEPDTFFSIPAATRKRGKYVKGFITTDESGYIFHAMDSHEHILKGV